ncbi:hypothetical protein LTR62_007385 [Meristemomyces frigidus]|uniref:Uncharacterized protein n=1 Tax=Meristemomyces frigidus TaxID=1508187 RepID=A0AAN7TNG8_9PEZI|nr:hypothetical protein LTR62_007385 [Meristemomyces frigidus]
MNVAGSVLEDVAGYDEAMDEEDSEDEEYSEDHGESAWGADSIIVALASRDDDSSSVGGDIPSSDGPFDNPDERNHDVSNAAQAQYGMMADIMFELLEVDSFMRGLNEDKGRTVPAKTNRKNLVPDLAKTKLQWTS